MVKIYRDETFKEFWKSERSLYMFLPFLIAGLVAIGTCITQVLKNNILFTFFTFAGFLFLAFIALAYLAFYFLMYHFYKKGYTISTAINGTKNILNDVKVYNGNIAPVFGSLSFVSYDFDKADIILTEYSLIILGITKGFRNLKYAEPIELMLDDRCTENSYYLAKIVKHEIKSDRVILHIKDSNYKQIIKVNIKSEIEVVKNWLKGKISSIYVQ